MGVYILGVSGSPIRHGNTALFLEESMRAAREMGEVETELITLDQEVGQSLRDCNHCNWCLRSQEEGRFCKYQDGDIMGELYPKILRADGLLLATPTYIARLSGYMAKFLDRFRCLAEGKYYSGCLKDKAVGALAVLWMRHSGAETTLLSIVEGVMHLGMHPIGSMRGMSGSSYGAVGVASYGGTGQFDKKDRTGVLKDEFGMKCARNLGQNVVEFVRTWKAGQEAVARENGGEAVAPVNT